MVLMDREGVWFKGCMTLTPTQCRRKEDAAESGLVCAVSLLLPFENGSFAVVLTEIVHQNKIDIQKKEGD